MSIKSSVTAILLRMDRIQQMYKAAAEDVSLPADAVIGAGAGGLGSALHSQLPALRELRPLKEQMPNLLRLKGYFDKETDDA